MSWTHLRDETPQAAKRHQCYLCGRGILVGERHVVRSGIGDRGLDRFRMHTRCEAATESWDEMDWESFCGPSEEFYRSLTPVAPPPVDRRPA